MCAANGGITAMFFVPAMLLFKDMDIVHGQSVRDRLSG